MVGLLLSEVLFGSIMFLGMRAGLDCRLMGWGWNCLLLLAVAIISYCLLMSHLLSSSCMISCDPADLDQ
jgi:hypothetical protein